MSNILVRIADGKSAKSPHIIWSQHALKPYLGYADSTRPLSTWSVGVARVRLSVALAMKPCRSSGHVSLTSPIINTSWHVSSCAAPHRWNWPFSLQLAPAHHQTGRTRSGSRSRLGNRTRARHLDFACFSCTCVWGNRKRRRVKLFSSSFSPGARIAYAPRLAMG